MSLIRIFIANYSNWGNSKQCSTTGKMSLLHSKILNYYILTYKQFTVKYLLCIDILYFYWEQIFMDTLLTENNDTNKKQADNRCHWHFICLSSINTHCIIYLHVLQKGTIKCSVKQQRFNSLSVVKISGLIADRKIYYLLTSDDWVYWHETTKRFTQRK